jgi:hypothetical protein
MKKLLLGAAAAAMTLTGFAASAQSYGGHDNGRSHSQHSDWNRGANRGADQSRNYGYNQRSDWNRGGQYRGSYSSYGYDRDDNGLSSALAGGLLGFVLGSALSNNGNQGYQSYGYAQPTYQQPYGYGGYGGYQQPYGYR